MKTVEMKNNFNLRQRPEISFSALLLCLIVMIQGGCAHVGSYSTYSEVGAKSSESKEQKHVKKITIEPALDDNNSSRILRMKVMEHAVVSQSVRDVKVVSVYKYPYSFGRKLDDMLVGILGAPFTPLAMIGGLAEGDPDFITFPFSALNPFTNFRPNKHGLFAEAIPGKVEKKYTKGQWRDLGPKEAKMPLRFSNIYVQIGNKTIKSMTDKNGVAMIDLLEIPGAYSYRDLYLSVRANQLYANYKVEGKRLLSIKEIEAAKEKLALGTTDRIPMVQSPTPVLPKVVPPMPKKTQPSQTPKPLKIEKNLEFSSQDMPADDSGRYSLYKVNNYGYWINQSGLAVMAFPVGGDVQIYADEYLRYKLAQRIVAGKGYYIFGFSFDPVKNITLAVKIGLSPFEKNAYGWVLAEDVFLWNTPHRLKMTKPIGIYETYDSCMSGKEKLSYVYFPDTQTKVLYLPVLERRGLAWCVAYPSYSPGQPTRYKSGWVRWIEEPGVELEVRIMKHKLEAAVYYLEKNVVWGEKSADLQKELEISVEGPLVLKKLTGEMFLSSLNQEQKSEQRTIVGQLLKVPTDSAAYDQFQSYVLTVADLIVKQDIEDNEDAVYFSLGRLLPSKE